MFTARSELVLGPHSTARLSGCTVAVIGIGGVGCAAVEALARSGVGSLILLDHDRFSESNKNRQLYATDDTLGAQKVEAARDRVLRINPDAVVHPLPLFLNEESIGALFALRPDYIIDAIDTITMKLLLALHAQQANIPHIAAMGTGGRMDPTQFRVGDIADTAGSGCPVARVMRRECKKRGIGPLKVVYSRELPLSVTAEAEHGRHPPGSVAFVPSVAGFILAGEAVKELLREA